MGTNEIVQGVKHLSEGFDNEKNILYVVAHGGNTADKLLVLNCVAHKGAIKEGGEVGGGHCMGRDKRSGRKRKEAKGQGRQPSPTST
jgi:hypothetical protein